MSDDDEIIYGFVKTRKDQPAVIVAGIPVSAWQKMGEGKMPVVDLTRIGMPLQLIFFACGSHQHGMDILAKHEMFKGQVVLDARGTQLDIKLDIDTTGASDDATA